MKRRIEQRNDGGRNGLMETLNDRCKEGFDLSGGFTPCRHLRPSSGREHTIV